MQLRLSPETANLFANLLEMIEETAKHKGNARHAEIIAEMRGAFRVTPVELTGVQSMSLQGLLVAIEQRSPQSLTEDGRKVVREVIEELNAGLKRH